MHLWVDCSSVNPSFSQKMAAEAARRQIRFVDAPVTGTASAAAEGSVDFLGGRSGGSTWKQVAHSFCAWATKLFMLADTEWGPP